MKETLEVINRAQAAGVITAYAIGGAVSVVSVAVLAPAYGLRGAVWAGYAAEAAMVMFLLHGTLRTRQYPA